MEEIRQESDRNIIAGCILPIPDVEFTLILSYHLWPTLPVGLFFDA
jgi:hypothetical protein